MKGKGLFLTHFYWFCERLNSLIKWCILLSMKINKIKLWWCTPELSVALEILISVPPLRSGKTKPNIQGLIKHDGSKTVIVCNFWNYLRHSLHSQNSHSSGIFKIWSLFLWYQYYRRYWEFRSYFDLLN